MINEKKFPHDDVSHKVENEKANQPQALEAGLSGDKGETIIVSWDGPDDPLNPRNWSFRKKWGATTVVSAYTFITPIASSMVAPATNVIAREFNITNDVVNALVVSIFILSFACGPLFIGPLSEIYGRARVLQISNLFFLVFNIACGFSRSTGEILAFRLLSGLGGSAPLAIGGGVLGDCWAPEQRGQAVAIYSLAPILGPVIGPIVGSWISEKTTWRWVFWSTSIFCGIIQVFGFILLRETFPPVLLEKKAHRMRLSMGLDSHRIRTQYETPDRHWQQIFSRALSRPFVMFYREPIVQLLGIYMAFVLIHYYNYHVPSLADLTTLSDAVTARGSIYAYKRNADVYLTSCLAGLLYLILTTVPGIYQGTYGQPVGIAGLHYAALGIGLTGSSQINARALDRIYKRLIAKNGGEGKPEYRLPSMFPGAALLPIGLLIFGWSAQAGVFWIVPDIGLALIGGGIMLIFQSIQTYVIDTFTLHAASALAAVACLRSLAGFGFPLFAPAMYNALGYGKGDTILAVAGIVIGWPAPFLFWIYGERIRLRSRYVDTH